MLELSANSFHDTMAAHAMVVCVLYVGPFDDWEETASTLRAGAAGKGAWTWARLNVAEAPDIARMFGLSDGGPYLLIMRECVVLHCEPLATASPEAAGSLLDRAARLDMARVREHVEQERLSRESLFERRICPTARRTRCDGSA